MKKRGAVEISLSMIIIIIIAVIVLISGLGLITGGLSKVTDLWDRALKSVEPSLAEPPSFNTPIVWGLGDITSVNTGKEYVVEIAVLNTQDSTISRKVPELVGDGSDCRNWLGGMKSKTVASGEVGEWKGIFKVPLGTIQKTYICELEIDGISEEIAITTT
ncbi:hypothetical protein CL618_02250 [archaeon]|nr:hypothetical protein [archaeon]|tara:strand:+ start:853 stop:1335 length:483 start_codon:yes stop_codon:yes gene_type:complete